MPACDYVHEYSFVATKLVPETEQTDYLVQESNNQTMEIYSNEAWNTGLWTVVSTITLTDYASSRGDAIWNSTFNIELIDPCLTSKLQPSFEEIHVHTIIG